MSLDAHANVAMSPGSQSMAEQDDCVPPADYVPAIHGEQSVSLLAPTISPTKPASQLMVEQVVSFWPKLYSPAEQSVHPPS